MPVNEINNFKIQEWIEFSNSDLAGEMLSHIEHAISAIEEARQSLNNTKNYQATWEGNAKGIHDDLYNFCEWYGNDLIPALNSYKDAVKILDEELRTLATESNVIKAFKEIEKL